MSATVFDTPLDARSLIEASAGTGKTYALAGLFARAVIVGRLRVPQILAVTYTIAATQELHQRVRRRLQAATELANAWRADAPAELAGDGAETALLRRLLHDALHDGSGESLAALRMRLARAAREMDMAAITTIHGFCQRLLAEHALEAGQPLLAAGIVPANTAHRRALALDVWRRLSGDDAGSDFLRRHFGSPGNLATALRDLLAPDSLLPPAPAEDACASRHDAWVALARIFQRDGGRVRAILLDLIANGLLSRDKSKTIAIDALWMWLDAQAETPPLCVHPQLGRLARGYLQTLCLKNSDAPDLPLCAAVERFLEADDASDVQRLHALRLVARQRDSADKRAARSRDYDDLITAVYDATCDATVAPRLAASLRGQFPLVLVDEFQDTDARQWAIFSRLFGEGGLLLVGDPKQAIYRFRGGDVETYLAARATAGVAAPLLRNYRSRPCVLAAVNALFEQAPQGALGAGIAFVRNEAGRDAGCDAHLLVDGLPAVPLRFHQVPARRDNGKPSAWSKSESIRIAAALCADAIRDLLHAARSGRVQRIATAGTLRALQPRDCAVLVRTHDEAAAVREELALRGVPAVSVGRDSLFATGQAQSLLALLLALATPGDPRRLRAALASPLFGLDAGALRALADDGHALSRWQQDFAQWRQRWEQHGPQALLADVVAQQAPRLLAFADGERELTYLLQLGELMQQARAQRLGPQGQLDWLRAAIADADGNDEAQQPRLESDAGRVQIVTLHASKGLEFPLVYMPFAGIGRGNGSAGKAEFVTYHDDRGERVRQWKTGTTQPGALPWKDAFERAQREARAEDMRLLYVGLTRARDALWLCGGALASSNNTALCQLFGGAAPSPALRTALAGLLQCEEGLSTGAGERLAPQSPPDVPAARTPRLRLQRDWWIHSFSSLHRQRAQATTAPAEDAPAEDEQSLVGAETGRVRFGGTRFGNALHQALEHVDFARWRDGDGAAVDPHDLAILKQALLDHDYAPADLDDGARELALLVARTLNAPLGVRAVADVRLCDVAPAARIAELEFHFTLAGTDTSALLALLQAHDIALDRAGFGSVRLGGLMNGKIDLTCSIDGRLYVVDYKSNRLPDYAPQALRQAMRASEYDLQALLYVVAVHRWLRLRRGDAYDYTRDIGGVRYLFSRGLQPSQPGQGVVRMDFPRELIESVDRLFAADGARA